MTLSHSSTKWPGKQEDVFGCRFPGALSVLSSISPLCDHLVSGPLKRITLKFPFYEYNGKPGQSAIQFFCLTCLAGE